MRAMSFRGFMVVALLSLVATTMAGSAFAESQQSAVDDSFDWASGIMDGLANLEAAPVAEPLPTPKPEDTPPRRKKHHSHRDSPAPMPKATVPGFVGRRLTLQKNTVFGVFAVTVIETGPNAFDLIIVSDDPAENVEVKDSVANTVYVNRPLDDETTFKTHVPAHLSPAIAVSVSVVQDGDINKAYFPLLGSDFRN